MTKKVKKVVRKTAKEDSSGILIPAGLLLGIGIGILAGNTGAWTLIGLGAGFAGMWFVKNK